MPQRVLHIRGEAFRIADPCLPPSNCRQQLGEVEALPRHTAASGLFPRFIAKRAPPGMFVKSATLPQSWDNFVLVPPPPKAAHPPSWLDSPAVPSVITPSMHIRPGRTWTTLTNASHNFYEGCVHRRVYTQYRLQSTHYPVRVPWQKVKFALLRI